MIASARDDTLHIKRTNITRYWSRNSAQKCWYGLLVAIFKYIVNVHDIVEYVLFLESHGDYF